MKKVLFAGATAAVLCLAGGRPATASSHREAPDTVNHPCYDNADVYAWVKPGAHDKLYLLATINPLHEPGQGNQQIRFCDDVLYEFHVTKGAGVLHDFVTYQLRFKTTPPTAVNPSDLGLPPGGGKELLVQLGVAGTNGVTQTYTVTKVTHGPGNRKTETIIGRNLPVAPPNIGPRTDRIAYGLGAFNPTDADSNTVSLYTDEFSATFIKDLDGGEGRAWAGERDDPFYLDEKAIFDVLNLSAFRPGSKGSDVFKGFNINLIALEIDTARLLGGPIPHNGTPGNDTLLGVWVSESMRKQRILRADGEDGSFGPWVQVGREGLPLVNAGLIGVQDQNKYLRTTPRTDVANFAAYFLSPILVRDLEFLGAYAALNVPQATIDMLKSNRTDILDVINLKNIPSMGAHSVPIMPGYTGDVLRVDVATDSGFPNGRPIPGGASPNQEQADVSDVLITVICSGGAIPLSDGAQSNDKPYLATFPFAARPHTGLTEGHGGPTTP